MTQAEDRLSEEVQPTGRFRIYLGAAAGVGKTVAMIDEGCRRARRGRDVVIGFVETHGRPYTAQRAAELEAVPRKKVQYRGVNLEEMDTEAVIRRKPEVALVDELAHTNVPGSGPHEKRWEDVLQIIEAGIAVITTVNIQHLESIADAVEQITGARVSERVPDWVVRRADQLELIDSSPEQLRRRMIHGNIYPPEKVPAALSSFFRQENLAALRELALRFVADETEDEIQEYLARHHGVVWDTTERILVAVSGAPTFAPVVRRAARLAVRTKGELFALHITSDRAQTDDVTRMRQLVDDVGGRWDEMVSDDPAAAILEFARRHAITQIVLGASRRSRWEELSRGSLVRRVLRAAAEAGIDVHVIARPEPEGGGGDEDRSPARE